MVAPKYDKQLVDYVNQTLSLDEKNLYASFMQELKEKHKLNDLNDLMLLDTTVHDFIRIKRLQKVIQEHGDTFVWQNRQGTSVVKVNEASKLLLQLENQFRNNLKEMLMTKKSAIIQQMKVGEKSFSDFLNAKPVKVEVEKPLKEEDQEHQEAGTPTKLTSNEGDKNKTDDDVLDFFTSSD